AVVKLHGSDLNIIAKLPGPQRVLRATLPRAARVVAVSRALADEARALGVADDRIAVVMNGVDSKLFHPRDRTDARRALDLHLGSAAKPLLSVGNLKELKGVADLIAAFDRVADLDPELHLAVVGGGDMAPRLAELAMRHPGRVLVPGARPLAEIPLWMA